MATTGISGSTTTPFTQLSPDAAEKQSVLSQLTTSLQSSAQDSVSISGVTDQLSKNLSVLAQQVLEKLNQAVGDQIPGGLTNLAPEDHTPEKTAQTIVDGVSQLFSVFSQQNKGLSNDDLVTKFIATVKGGIEKGYAQADQILGDAGAYDLTGIRDGVDQTKKLVEEKLKALEDRLRGKDTQAASSATDASSTTSTSVSTTQSTSTTVSAVA